MLRAADANGDRSIARAEFDALAAETFEWRDRNADGVLDIDDQSPAMRRLAALREADADGSDRRPRRWAGRDGADADDDGRITREEFDAREAEMFARLDADSDGVVTPAELDARVEARRERGRWWRTP